MRKFMFCSMLGLATSVLAQSSSLVPEPAVASPAWQLKFRFQDPQRISVVLPDRKEPVVFWYMLYTVENPTDREVDFYPKFEVVTDTLQIVRSDVDVSPEAYRAVFRRAGNPLLVTPEKVTGKLLRGHDRMRQSVAIWPDIDPTAKAFTVFVAGLSGEVARWKNPVFDEAKPEGPGNQRYFLLRKTLAIPYSLPGSDASRFGAVPRRLPEKQDWVMR